jgi:hypothetical protein
MMTRFSRPLLALAVTLALGACQKQSAPPAATTTPAPASTPATTPPPAAPAAPVVAAADTVGVAECDEYLSRYEACVGAKVPEASRDALKQGLDATRASWRAAAATEAGKAGLATACVQAREAAKASLSAYGCTDL